MSYTPEELAKLIHSTLEEKYPHFYNIKDRSDAKEWEDITPRARALLESVAEVVLQRIEEDNQRQLDDVYTQRNHLVQLSQNLAFRLGLYRKSRCMCDKKVGDNVNLKDSWYTVGQKDDPDDKNYRIYFIELPTGQVSWHIPNYDSVTGLHSMKYRQDWDGHTTPEKTKRIKDFLMGVGGDF